MSATPMLDKLDRYYCEQGIAALDFKCKHRDACRALCPSGRMISVPESYVGADYEKGKVPRLLFVSSDTNDAEWLKNKPEWGALRAIREIMWRDRNEDHKQKTQSHWHQTVKMAQLLLAPYLDKRLGEAIAFNDYVSYFANLTSTRCKDDSRSRKEGNGRMTSNCRGFLKGEIEIMRPDIIVVQGKRAKNALWNAFPVVNSVRMPGNPRHGAFYEIIRLPDDHDVIKIFSWHPCAHWKGDDKKQFLEWAAESVHAFIPFA